MIITLSLLALLSGAVFAISAIAKLADRDGAKKAIVSFGLPTSLAGPMSIFLPIVELAVAGVLILTTSTWLGGIGALALLLIFTTAITINLAKGRSFDCHCFGQIHARPIGTSTVIRNLVLIAAAALIAWQGRSGLGVSPIRALIGFVQTYPSLVFDGAIVALLITSGWLILHLFRQNGRLLLRMDRLESLMSSGGTARDGNQLHAPSGLPIGSRAPAFELPRVSGESLSLDALLLDHKPILLVFSDPKCAPCEALMPDLAHWEEQHSNELVVVLISREDKGGTTFGKYQLRNVLVQQNHEVSEKFHSAATPSALLIRADGSIGSHIAMGSQAIAELVAETTKTVAPIRLPVVRQAGHHLHSQLPTHAVGSSVGQPAPVIELPDLNGRNIRVPDFKGRDTLLLFWNPKCSFCKEMLPALKAWNPSRANASPELLIISTGTVEENRLMELQSTIILDPNFNAAQAFRINATPSGVLIDAEGNVASAPAVGAPAVLNLMATKAGIELARV